MITSVLLLALGLARAETPGSNFGHERIFALEFAGQRSILFAIDNVPHEFGHREITAARAALDVSCAVLLQGHRLIDRDEDRDEPVDIAHQLSRSGRETVRRLGLDKILDRPHSVSTEYARRLIKMVFADYRVQSAQTYAREFAESGKLLPPQRIAVIERLHTASELLFRPLSDQQLVARALAWDEDRRAGNLPVTIDDFERFALGRAEALDAEVVHLDTFIPAPTQKPDLEAMLMFLRPLVAKENIESLYWNEMVARLLDFNLSQRYFDLEPRTYAMIRDELARSGLVDYSYWPGEEGLAAHAANAHESWVGPVMKALAQGRAFITLESKYVLPDITSKRLHSLLELLEAKGVKITPILAREHKLHAAK